jgi:ubiquinone/menaquinone biosynthesis C-methylase UbiE
MSIRAAYDAAADAWVSGPDKIYERLAEALLDSTPVPLVGAAVLDVGTGTGVAARATHARGATTVVGTDISTGMLAYRGPDVAGIVCDAVRLPFADGSFDLVVSAFCLSHLENPLAAVTESRRVAPAYLASAFAPGPEHPAKAVIDDVMSSFGFDPPAWYSAFKESGALVEDPDRLAELATKAGFSDIDVVRCEVDAGLSTPTEVVAWRWGMAHLAPFVSSLSPVDATEARAECEAAVAGMPPVRLAMLALSAAAQRARA